MSSAKLRGRHVQLRPLLAGDYEFVQALELRSDRLESYRHRGITPSPEAFVQRLWHGVLVQFVIEDHQTSPRARLGIVSAYQADFRNRNAQLALLSAGSADYVSGTFMEGVELFISYLFTTFNFRKLSSYILACNLAPFQSLVPSIAREEGRLEGHEFYDGKWIDVHLFSIFEQDWSRRSGQFLSEDRRTMDRDRSIASPQAFVELIDEVLELDIGDHEDAFNLHLQDDLGLDSLALLVLLDIVETDDFQMDQAALLSLTTLRDAYHFYAAARNLS